MIYIIRNLIFIFFSCLFIISCSNSNKNTDINLENTIQEKMKIALEMQDIKDYPKAVENFREIVKLKDTPEHRVCLGCALLINCQYLDAIEEFSLAIKKYEELSLNFRVNAFFGIVHSYIMTDQYKKAYEIAKNFYDVLDFSQLSTDEKINSFMHLGKAEVGIGLYKDAITHFKKALEIEDRGFLYIGLSKALYGDGQYKEALEACNTAISKEDSGRTRFGLAEIKWKTGDLFGALEEFKIAAIRVKQTPTAVYRTSEAEWIEEGLRIEERIKAVKRDIKNKIG